jgi:hypothetical protein
MIVVLNPSFVTLMLYVPGFVYGKMKCPLSFAVVVLAAPVEVSVNVTDALGTTAPVPSDTVPARVPESDDCASKTGDPIPSRTNTTHNMPETTTRLELIAHPPLCALHAPAYTSSFGAHHVRPFGLSFFLLTGNLTPTQPTKTVPKKFLYFVSHFGC